MEIKFANRVSHIKKSSKKGKYILYWMQGAFRTQYNHTLEFAIYLSRQLKIPLLVLIVVDFNYKDANYRTFRFFCEGLWEVKNTLLNRKIGIHIRVGDFFDIVKQYAHDVEVLVTDKAYLPFIKNVRNEVYRALDAQIYEVDTNIIVPVEKASVKMEYAAYSLRPKISLVKDYYIDDFWQFEYNSALIDAIFDINEKNFDEVLRRNCEFVQKSPFAGGTSNAYLELDTFIEKKFFNYAKLHNDPTFQVESNLSLYLHYGHISPMEILKKLPHDGQNFDAFFEQLVIRRELAFNLAFYSKSLESFDAYLPKWALDSLKKHSIDKREYVYSSEEFEKAKTHDKYWNAAQSQLILSGKIHNYMRMYWGKKIIEWSLDYKGAYETMVYLNNKYAIDGRDPNSYCGILWCFGMHDRPFKERDIFGKIRYMSENGLKRKFDIDKYSFVWLKNA